MPVESQIPVGQQRSSPSSQAAPASVPAQSDTMQSELVKKLLTASLLPRPDVPVFYWGC